MSQTTVTLVALFFIGGTIGLLFFGGLWLTLKLCVARKGGYIWHFSGFILRAGLTCGAFFVLMQGDWQRLAALAAGFMCVRICIVRAVKLNLNNCSKAGSL